MSLLRFLLGGGFWTEDLRIFWEKELEAEWRKD